MNALELYKELTREISAFLRERGFSRSGNCFYVQQAGNWGLLCLQKSRRSTTKEALFTINLGVCSGRLIEFFSPEAAEQKPSIEACHWRERAGFLLPKPKDKWWVIHEVEPLNSLLEELKDFLVQAIIPEIERHLPDEYLCNEWLSGKSTGLTDIQRLMNLSVLLKAASAEDKLSEVRKELEDMSAGKPTAFMIKQHLQRLGQSSSKG